MGKDLQLRYLFSISFPTTGLESS